jgi:hypothetical protein
VLHPGFVNTNFGEGNRIARFFFRLLGVFAKSPEEGAETPIYLASSDEVEGINGKYWKNSEITESTDDSYDREKQERLWRTTEEMLDISWDKKLPHGNEEAEEP